MSAHRPATDGGRELRTANKVTFYDGTLRVVDPAGQEFLAFHARDYLGHIAEHVEPWSYMKFCFLPSRCSIRTPSAVP